MSNEPTTTFPVKYIRCPKCQAPVGIEVSAKFECSKCGRIKQVTVDRVTGPIVWLVGKQDC
jgi:hypothetical protein